MSTHLYHSKILEESILKTLVFFDLFQQPLTLKELRQYLLSFSATEEELLFCLEKMPHVSHFGGLYYLKGRESILHERAERAKVSGGFFRRVRFFLFFLRRIPFVKMIAVCNRLAMNNANEKSDIDLFVIASCGRLFFVRTCLMALFGIFRVRAHDKKSPGKFCLSFLVDENVFDLRNLQEQPFDIYLAYWTATLRPILGKDIYESFLKKNDWTRNFFGREIVSRVDDFVKEKTFFAKFFEWIFSGRLGDLIEKKLTDWQLARAISKFEKMNRPHGTILQRNMLKFHYPDKRREYRERWEAAIRNF